jgi:hypothetical protein
MDAALCGKTNHTVGSPSAKRAEDWPPQEKPMQPNISSRSRCRFTAESPEYLSLFGVSKQCFYWSRFSLGSTCETIGSALR